MDCHVLSISYTAGVEFHKTYKQRLLPTLEQEKFCNISAGIIRQVYNAALEQRKLAYMLTQKSLNYYDQANELSDLKKDLTYISIAPSQSLQQGLKDLDKAFDRFFKGISGFPTFRRKGINDSFRLPDPKAFNITRVSKRKGFITLPKLGNVFFRWTRGKKNKKGEGGIKGRPLFATVLKEAGAWYVAVTCSVKPEDLIGPGKPLKPVSQRTPLGIDRGCNHTIATSETIDNSHLHSLPTSKLKRLENRIKLLQRILARKVKRSKNSKKVKADIAKMHRKLRNLRHDWHHKMTTKIAKNHSYIFLEALDVKEMTKSNNGTKENPGTDVAMKSGLNKAILRQAWGVFDSMLTYKTCWYWSEMGEKPNPAYTSQKCHSCKFIHPLNRDGEAFVCRRCNHTAHSDVNAAKNILEAGLALIACETSNASSQEPLVKPKKRSKVLTGIPGL